MDRILKKINSKNNPVVVTVELERYSKPDNCFFNVQEKISKDNGEIIYGWKLHQTPILMEAERHAVWKSPNGKLIDITPDPTSSQSILFVQEDNCWTYNGEYTDNIRVKLTDNSIVDDFILLSETITKLYQTGERKTDYEIALIEPVHKLILFFEQDKVLRHKFIYSGKTIHDDCYCDSSLKYKECHGKGLEGIYSEILDKIQILIKVNS